MLEGLPGYYPSLRRLAQPIGPRFELIQDWEGDQNDHSICWVLLLLSGYHCSFLAPTNGGFGAVPFLEEIHCSIDFPRSVCIWSLALFELLCHWSISASYLWWFFACPLLSLPPRILFAWCASVFQDSLYGLCSLIYLFHSWSHHLPLSFFGLISKTSFPALFITFLITIHISSTAHLIALSILHTSILHGSRASCSLFSYFPFTFGALNFLICSLSGLIFSSVLLFIIWLLYLIQIRKWLNSQSVLLNVPTSITLDTFLLLISAWSIWLCVLPSDELQVHLWISYLGKHVELITMCLDRAKFINRLPLFSLCRLCLPVIRLISGSLLILALKSPKIILISLDGVLS